MVLLMLVLMAIQAGTGLFTTDAVIWAGPYNPAVSESTASFLSTVHDWNFNLIIAAVVGLHRRGDSVLCLLQESQNLVAPMLSGHKPAALVPEHEAIGSSQLIRALVVSLVAAGLVYWLLAHAPVAPDNTY